MLDFIPNSIDIYIYLYLYLSIYLYLYIYIYIYIYSIINLSITPHSVRLSLFLSVCFFSWLVDFYLFACLFSFSFSICVTKKKEHYEKMLLLTSNKFLIILLYNLIKLGIFSNNTHIVRDRECEREKCDWK